MIIAFLMDYGLNIHMIYHLSNDENSELKLWILLSKIWKICPLFDKIIFVLEFYNSLYLMQVSMDSTGHVLYANDSRKISIYIDLYSNYEPLKS